MGSSGINRRSNRRKSSKFIRQRHSRKSKHSKKRYSKVLKKSKRKSKRDSRKRSSKKRRSRRRSRRSSERSSRRSSRRKSSRRKSSGLRARGAIRKGTLRRFGYSTDKTTEERHTSIKKAVNNEGKLPIFRKLNALYVLTRNNNPHISRIFYRDRNFVKREL